MIDELCTMIDYRRSQIPFCEKASCVLTCMFEYTKTACIKCKKFHCDECAKRIWSGERDGESFIKPKMVLPRLRHHLFHASVLPSIGSCIATKSCSWDRRWIHRKHIPDRANSACILRHLVPVPHKHWQALVPYSKLAGRRRRCTYYCD